MTSPLNLPRHAWRNAKSYADTVFPANGVVGDRILRTDLGMWFTFVTIGGVNYWAPDPGSTVVSVRQTSVNALVAATDTHVTNMTTLLYNYDTYWASNVFTPKVPGYYLCGGGVGFATVAGPGNYRQAFLQKNATTDVIGSGGRVTPVAGSATTVNLRPVPVFFNGTTDSVRLMANSSLATDTVASTTFLATHFWAQFAGPFVE